MNNGKEIASVQGEVLKKEKALIKVSYFLWTVVFLLALVTGTIGINNLLYIEQSVKLTAVVTDKYASQSSSGTGSSRTVSTSLKILYQFENPYKKDKIELVSELAPLVYATVNKGDDIAIYYNETAKPKTRISQPLHFWMIFFISSLVFGAALLMATLVSRQSALTKERRRQLIYLVLVMFILPIVVNILSFTQQNNQLQAEREAEADWPRWPAFETAVPKPEWWDQVSIKYFDPMDYTSEEYSDYVKHNTDSDKYHRSFKVTYALMLKHQDDPYTLGGLLGRGTTRQYMSIYEFFLSQYMHQEWQGEYCSQPCNDATQMVEMAGVLMSMKLDENQIDSSLKLAIDIMQYKFSRANNRGKYYFLNSYRRLLEHLEGKEVAKLTLGVLVEESLQEAVEQGLTGQVRKWKKFWSSSQREIGIYSK